MSACIPKKKIRRLRFFALDTCGRLITTGTPVLDWMGFNEVRWQNVIDDGVDELITNINNEACIDDPACPIDRGVSFTFTECKENEAFAALTGHGSVVTTAGVVTGFNRQKMPDQCPGLAMEILFDTPTVCDAEGNEQCVGMLVPHVRLFKDVSERLINGSTTVRGTYTARATLNPRLWELFGSAGPPVVPAEPTGELAHWAPHVAAVTAGDAWYIRRVLDCPTGAGDETNEDTCELRAYSTIATGPPAFST